MIAYAKKKIVSTKPFKKFPLKVSWTKRREYPLTEYMNFHNRHSKTYLMIYCFIIVYYW